MFGSEDDRETIDRETFEFAEIEFRSWAMMNKIYSHLLDAIDDEMAYRGVASEELIEMLPFDQSGDFEESDKPADTFAFEGAGASDSFDPPITNRGLKNDQKSQLNRKKTSSTREIEDIELLRLC